MHCLPVGGKKYKKKKNTHCYTHVNSAQTYKKSIIYCREGSTHTCWRWGCRTARSGAVTDPPLRARLYGSGVLKPHPGGTSHPELQFAPTGHIQYTQYTILFSYPYGKEFSWIFYLKDALISFCIKYIRSLSTHQVILGWTPICLYNCINCL